MTGAKRWNANVQWHGIPLSSSSFVYRYFPLHRALQLFQSCRLPMLLPTSWWDPLETVWTRQQYQKKRILGEKTVFGSCWTLGARNDALWQIYSKSAPAVRVRTTVGALTHLLTNAELLENGKIYFGKVVYCIEDELVDLSNRLEKATLKKDIGRHLVEGMMHKRLAFQFEQELRVLWVKSGKDPRQAINIPYVPRMLFDQVRIDPRLEASFAADISAALTTVSGLSNIKQSSLASATKL